MTENQQHLEQHLARYGLTSKDVVRAPDGCMDNVKPVKVLKTSDLDELKHWIGVPDELGKQGQRTKAIADVDPRSLSASRINDLESNHVQAVVEAARTYVFGDSSVVHHWKETIVKYLAPFHVPVYAVENITVTPDNPWVLEGTSPQVYNVGTVTIEPGGEIIVKVDATVNAQTVIKE